MATWKLTIEDDEGQKTTVPLVRDVYTIGRREGHAIRLTERNISRDHLKLRLNGESLQVEDLGSYNGVFLNGHRVAEAQRVKPGDLIVIGDYRIEIQNDDQPRLSFPVPGPASSAPPPSSVLGSRPPEQHAPVAPQAAALAPSGSPAASATPTPSTEFPGRLILLTGHDGGKEFRLTRRTMTVGRGDEVDIRVNHSSVSRCHCELRVLGTERGARGDESDGGELFEVIDQASANGIRINGRELKRGTLAPGDTLELGDVHLRYVGAGQPFVFDAAVAEAARLSSERSPRARRSSAMAWGLVVSLVAVAAVAGVVYEKQSRRQHLSGATGVTGVTGVAPVSTPIPSGISEAPPRPDEPLQRAQRLKEDGDLDGAHQLLRSIESDSPLRKEPAYRAIENAWADRRLKEIGTQTDDAKKKSSLIEVQSSGADDSYRTSAADFLSDLEKKSNPSPSATSPRVASAAPAPASAPVEALAKRPPAAAPPPPQPPPLQPKPSAAPPRVTPIASSAPPPKPTPPPTGGTPGVCGSWRGDYMAAMRAKDYDCVRSMLFPRLSGGAISGPEARYLKAACAALGDNACQKRAAEKIP